MDKKASSEAVWNFISNQHSATDKSRRDMFQGQCSVSVDTYLYSDIYVTITYSIPYMDYSVNIVWEDDDTQPDYKSLGLHGKYSSSFQDFSFDKKLNTLSFKDGIRVITIHPNR